MQAVTDTVNIIEVGPRDGLQFETRSLPTDDKVLLVEKLIDAGLDQIEVGSFAAAETTPQLADTDQLFKKLDKKREFVYSAQVANEKEMRRALQTEIKNITVFMAASETFTQKNFGCTIDESLDQLKPVFELARDNDIEIRGYVACVFACPYEGQIKLSKATGLAEKLYRAGCSEISLSDTMGVGTPNQAQTLILHAGGIVPIDKIAVHFHNSCGQALANILASLEMGISSINTAVAGLGGFPNTKGASGNVATEDVIYMLHGLGIDSSVNLEKIIEVGQWLSEKLGRANASHVGRVSIPDWILDS